MHLPPAYAELRPARQIVADLKYRRKSQKKFSAPSYFGCVRSVNSAGKDDITFSADPN